MGIRSTNLERKFAVDELIGNVTEDSVLKTVRIPFASLASQLSGTGSFIFGNMIYVQTRAQLLAITPDSETAGGVVLNDSTATYNGYYSRVAGAWVWGRGFPDTFARVTTAGSANAQTGTVATGVVPADIEVFFAVVVTENTGPMTLSIAGETPRDVVNAAGLALSAGEWTSAVLFFLNDDGDYQLLIDAGAAASAAASAAAAAQALADALAMIVPDDSVTEPKIADSLALMTPHVITTKAAQIGLDPARWKNTIFEGSVFEFTSSDLSSILVVNSVTTTAVDSGTETFTKSAHGLKTGHGVTPTTSVNGLTADALYYVIRVTADTFRVASTMANALAGTAFNLTGTTNLTFKRILDHQQGIYRIPTGLARDGSQGAIVLKHDCIPNVRWWGAVAAPLGGLATVGQDNFAAFQSAIDVVGHGALFMPRGNFLLKAPLTVEVGQSLSLIGVSPQHTPNMSLIQDKGTVLYGAHAGAAVLNLKGGLRCHIENFNLWGDQTIAPKSFLAMGRNAGESSGRHTSRGVNCVGYVTKTGIYNCASEENKMELAVNVLGGGALESFTICETDVHSIDSFGSSSMFKASFRDAHVLHYAAAANAVGIKIYAGPQTQDIVFNEAFVGMQTGAGSHFVEITMSADQLGEIIFDNLGTEASLAGAPPESLIHVEGAYRMRGLRATFSAGQYAQGTANSVLTDDGVILERPELKTTKADHPMSLYRVYGGEVINATAGELRGSWVTATAYVWGDIVLQGGLFYRNNAAHTSGVFATDQANGYWAPYQGSDLIIRSEAKGARLYGRNVRFVNTAASSYVRNSALDSVLGPVTVVGAADFSISNITKFTGPSAIAYTVTIDGSGAPNTFKWNKGAGDIATTVAITTQPQLLDNGVYIQFGATTGHAIGNSYSFTAYPAVNPI